MSGHGRPPSMDPKFKREGFRFSESDIEKLQYCVLKTGKSKTEIIRDGINKIYYEIKSIESEGTMDKDNEDRITSLEREVQELRILVEKLYDLPFIIAELAENKDD